MSTSTVVATSTARDVATKRLRKALVPLVVVVVVLTLTWLASLLLPTGDTEDFGPKNPRPTGARAVAQVLEGNGVSVKYTQSLTSALRLANAQATVLIYSTGFEFEGSQITALIESGANIVLASPTPDMLAAANMGLTHGGYQGNPDPIAANCSVPGAIAAGTITSNGVGFKVLDYGIPQSLVSCFETEQGAHFAQYSNGNQTISALADADSWSNRRILEAGNSALALHTLGKSETLIWFHPQDTPVVLEGDTPALPPRFAMATAVLLLAAVFLIFAAFRRFGPVVAERLPVVVKSSETTLGRGRLYRTSRAFGRAAGALRAATATRLAQRLGVPHSGDRAALLGAIHNATGHDLFYLEALFYGPAPTSDAELVFLGSNLSALESEIIQ